MAPVEIATTAYIAPISSGFGDLVVSLPVIQALIDAGVETHLVTRSSIQSGIASRIRNLAGEIGEDSLSSIPLNSPHTLINLRDHPLQTDHTWGSQEFEAQFGRLNIMRIVEMIAKDMGIDADFANLVPISFNPQPQFTNAVFLVPGAGFFVKHWLRKHWLELVRLLKSRGEQVFMIGDEKESPAVRELIDAGVPWVQTPSLLDAIDAISSAKAVIAVDTGLMHLAVHQGIPTVALFNRAAVFRREEQNCRTITAPSCARICADAYPIDAMGRRISFEKFEREADSRYCLATEEDSCMAHISVESVLQAFNDLIP